MCSSQRALVDAASQAFPKPLTDEAAQAADVIVSMGCGDATYAPRMLTLQDLVDNGTVGADGAEVLRDIGARAQSFLVFSLPRNAGKSTVTDAILAAAPSGTPRHDFLGTEAERDALLAQPAAGYVVVAEMGHRGRPGYLAEEEIPRVFELVGHGYALASSLHADTDDQVYEVLANNGVSRAVAGGVRYLVKVQPLGDPSSPDTKRIVEWIDEVHRSNDDVPLSITRRYG